MYSPFGAAFRAAGRDILLVIGTTAFRKSNYMNKTFSDMKRMLVVRVGILM